LEGRQLNPVNLMKQMKEDYSMVSFFKIIIMSLDKENA